jgi:VanZ family protein
MVEEEKLERVKVSGSNSLRFTSRLWRYGPPIIWAALIFIGSSNLLSASQTSSFLERPLHYLFPSASEATLASIHFAIRKGGHLTEYFILAVLAARAFRTSSRAFLRTRWFLVTLLLIIAYSLFDEFRQSFVSTRTASIFDSMIDSVGGLLGLLTMVWLRRGRNENKATSSEAA